LSWEDLPEQHVSARQRDSENSGLGAADVDADGYVPSRCPAHKRTALLLPPGASVVVNHGSGRVEVVTEVQGAELTGDRSGPAVVCRRPDRSGQDVDDVDVVFEVDGGRAARGQCQHRLAKAVGPVPGWIRAGVAAPMAPVSPEHLNARGIPVVPEQVG